MLGVQKKIGGEKKRVTKSWGYKKIGCEKKIRVKKMLGRVGLGVQKAALLRVMETLREPA